MVSALAGGDDGAVYNVNADTIAAKLAGAIKAEKLILLTSVAGVFQDPEDPASLISHMDRELMENLIRTSAQGGMKAKLEACRLAFEYKVPRIHIISGNIQNSVLFELFTNEGPFASDAAGRFRVGQLREGEYWIRLSRSWKGLEKWNMPYHSVETCVGETTAGVSSRF